MRLSPHITRALPGSPPPLCSWRTHAAFDLHAYTLPSSQHTSSHEYCRRNAEQRASPLRAGTLIESVEADKMFCTLHSKCMRSRVCVPVSAASRQVLEEGVTSPTSTSSGSATITLSLRPSSELFPRSIRPTPSTSPKRAPGNG